MSDLRDIFVAFEGLGEALRRIFESSNLFERQMQILQDTQLVEQLQMVADNQREVLQQFRLPPAALAPPPNMNAAQVSVPQWTARPALNVIRDECNWALGAQAPLTAQERAWLNRPSVRDADPPPYIQEGIADQVADGLAADVLPPSLYYLAHVRQSVRIPSTLVPGRVYKLSVGRIIAVEEKGTYCVDLCAQPKGFEDPENRLPWMDWVTFQWLNITTDERAWLSAANIIYRTTYGATWTRQHGMSRRKSRGARASG